MRWNPSRRQFSLGQHFNNYCSLKFEKKFWILISMESRKNRKILATILIPKFVKQISFTQTKPTADNVHNKRQKKAYTAASRTKISEYPTSGAPWCKYILTYCLYRALTKLAVANFQLPPPPPLQIDLNRFFSFFGRFQNPIFFRCWQGRQHSRPEFTYALILSSSARVSSPQRSSLTQTLVRQW
jgi:hypothetical protein